MCSSQDKQWRIVIGSMLVLIGVMDLGFEPAHRLIFGKASYASEASLYVPESDLELILERRCIHLFLAEYERTLVVRKDDRDLLRLAVADDSGGLSRMTVYRISESNFYLRGDLSFDRYYLDVSTLSVRRERLGERPPPARLVGAFDRDEGEWKFISVFSRQL